MVGRAPDAARKSFALRMFLHDHSHGGRVLALLRDSVTVTTRQMRGHAPKALTWEAAPTAAR